MKIERKNCVMPLELAMKRELACRDKLQKLTMVRGASSSNTNTSTCSRDGFLLSQVSPPILTQTPSTLPMPTPDPCLHPSLGFSPHQRPGLYFGPRLGQAPQRRPTSSMPLAGPPSPPILAHSATDHHLKRKEPILSDPWDFFCDICDIDCITEFNLRMHVKGQKHKAKLEQVKGMRTAGGGGGGGVEAKKIKRPHCELCGVFCRDHFSLWQHLLSRNHVLKMLGSDMKVKGRMLRKMSGAQISRKSRTPPFTEPSMIYETVRLRSFCRYEGGSCLPFLSSQPVMPGSLVYWCCLCFNIEATQRVVGSLLVKLVVRLVYSSWSWM